MAESIFSATVSYMGRTGIRRYRVLPRLVPGHFVRRMRFFAGVIAFCGQVAFVGLIAAILARRLVGPDFRYLLPASVLTGALMLFIAFDVSYMIGFTVDTGSVTSIIGGLFFMIIMTANRRKKNASWA